MTGAGAALYPGRWNTKGTPVIYTASAASLAILESWVQHKNEALMQHYSIMSVEFDPKLVTTFDLKESKLEKDWRKKPQTVAAQQYADMKLKTHLILEVPSVITPVETNYIINPNHPEFNQLKFGKPEHFEFDYRMYK